MWIILHLFCLPKNPPNAGKFYSSELVNQVSVRFTLSKMCMSANHSLALKAENLLMEMHVLTSILMFDIAFL